MKWFVPTEYVNSIYDIDIQSLKSNGVKVLILDIDNTLVPTSKKAPTASVSKWIETAQSFGMQVVLASNNSKNRVSAFNESLKLFAVHRASKPLKYGFNKIAKELNVTKGEMCMIGDQVFTDIWGANNAGVMSILVMPISTDEGFGVRLKRYIEKQVVKKHKMDTYCLIGNPVGHSKSPFLHNIVYGFYDIKARYLLCLVERENLGQTITQFKNTGVKGFNITVPFKQDIMQYIDEVSNDAKSIGSVNTVKIQGGKCYGYNTDGDGFIMQLKSDGIELSGIKVKIVGSGGSTPSIVYALNKQNVQSIIIYNRTLEKAQVIADRYDNVSAKPLSEFDAGDCDVLINTTSVGLHPDADKSPVESLEGISLHTSVYDIIYNPQTTRFMKMAEEMGCKAYNGYKLLVYQGLIADEIWFGKKIVNERLVQKLLYEMSGE